MKPTPPFEVVLSSLADALSLEKSRLVAGAYGDFPKISERKNYYLSLLDRHLSDPTTRSRMNTYATDIAVIKQMALENENLLNAARAGVNAAQNRLNKIMEREKAVGTYTEGGDKLRTHNAGVTRSKIA